MVTKTLLWSYRELLDNCSNGGLAAREACTLELATVRLGPPRRGRRPDALSQRLLLARRLLQWDVHVRGHVENRPNVASHCGPSGWLADA